MLKVQQYQQQLFTGRHYKIITNNKEYSTKSWVFFIFIAKYFANKKIICIFAPSRENVFAYINKKI